MRLNNEQHKGLQPYEEHFRTAVEGRWSRYPGATAMTYIHKVYTEVTGTQRRLNLSCSTCILHLLQDMGKIYFADKAERTAVEESAKAAEPLKKVTVKTGAKSAKSAGKKTTTKSRKS